MTLGDRIETVLRGLDEPSGSVSADSVGNGRIGDTRRVSLASPNALGTTTVIVKLAPADRGARSADLVRLHATEERFYASVAPLLPIRTPACHFIGTAPGTGRRCLVLEDVRDALPGDDVAGCDTEQAARVLSDAAQLHAWRPDHLDPRDRVWLATEWDLRYARLSRSGPTLVRAMVHRLRERLAPSLANALLALAQRPAPPVPPMERVVIHGDLRGDNVLFTPEGTCWLDWQTAGLGPGIADVAYFLSVALPSVERRRHERELLCHYRAGLAAHGVSASEAVSDAAFRAYRGHSLYFVAAASLLVDPTGPEADLFATMAERAAEAFADTDA